MTTENEGLYTNIETEKTAAGQDAADTPNQNMDTLPLGEGVRTVEEAENHEDNARWNDGNLPRNEARDGSREDN
ncbi:hypothetical protein IRY31_07925 [Corynebacterium afermentans subsp. lipophilum]|uniref:hypothetical protein n=1 Tax=Corynebacterium afermentans TaxID=38286 RepID=UPI00188AE46B|nr:hypothetical protein [Corynebacterium afermentans]MBF4547996.1 hypothetical protein [Corynebacterium afermentans subsp. lipophilum]WJY59732.1 hypothetical protein CAFEL_09970 [Corynebacterium afermentans subsp. lipophilum]